MNQGSGFQYGIIGRLKRPHDAYGLDPDQVCQIIATELIGYVNESDVIYVAPNYMIRLHDLFAQEAILSEPVMETNHFHLQMVPWSREHEWAQLPWIPEPPTETSQIVINPLEILPVVKKQKRTQGVHRLKDSFAAAIPVGYDLRAPDFSYLMITELRNFYESKFAAFVESKQRAQQMKSVIDSFIPDAEEMLPYIVQAIERSEDLGTSVMTHDQQVYVTQLQNAIHSTNVYLPRLLELADLALKDVDTPLNLEGFKEGPPTLEIAVPSSYAKRLKIIYDAAIRKIYQTTPIIETIKREENRYETYVTVDNFTRRYFGAHTKNAPAMEAAALFYALKHLTNVQGYSIVDLNYPLLQRLVSDIDSWNKRMNVFQLFSSIGLNEIERVHKTVGQKCDLKHLYTLNLRNVGSLIEATKMLTDALEHSYISMTDMFEHFQTAKEIYDGIKVGIYSPTKSVYHWGRARRPTLQSETAPRV